ncbi:MAG TPA: DUF4062 domain-containing protein [Rhizomicrobium sp.]|nr:DUF4062 domain-containing protein [Rhizomicrobium sp.]
MRKPTVFLSSTIYDFRDLRSALKYYLEQQGCEVLASEFNDFRKPLDAHSYDACLAALDRANYFVLLIGSRVGGWYDSANKVSITQQEYRCAYELHKKGRLNILTFVRSEVWQMREDRKALERYLAELNKEESEKSDILAYPNKFATDARFISAFIDEVGRNNETKTAIATGGARPTGNWIHVFREFSEIIGAVQPLIFAGLPADEAAFRTALEGELLEILATVMFRHKDKALNPIGALMRMKERCPITERPEPGSFMSLPTAEWDHYSTTMIGLLGKDIPTMILPQALTSSTFLQFDPADGMFRETPVRKLILRLIQEISWFNEKNNSEHLGTIFEHTPKRRPRGLTEVQIDAAKVAMLYHLGYRWGNILSLTEAILHYLQTGQFYEPFTFPYSPIEGFDDKLAQERPTTTDVRDYLTDRRKPRPKD